MVKRKRTDADLEYGPGEVKSLASSRRRSRASVRSRRFAATSCHQRSQ
jgi:hypothetical protein